MGFLIGWGGDDGSKMEESVNKIYSNRLSASSTRVKKSFEESLTKGSLVPEPSHLLAFCTGTSPGLVGTVQRFKVFWLSK